uniref:(northern house mosquito) hypothetical protein n=1 Tax=Culex pipiens TaxID=7175 RepID=A0A8D8H6D0_CULPI
MVLSLTLAITRSPSKTNWDRTPPKSRFKSAIVQTSRRTLASTRLDWITLLLAGWHHLGMVEQALPTTSLRNVKFHCPPGSALAPPASISLLFRICLLDISTSSVVLLKTFTAALIHQIRPNWSV